MGGTSEQDDLSRKSGERQSSAQIAAQERALEKQLAQQLLLDKTNKEYETNAASTAYERAMQQLNESLNRAKETTAEGESQFLSSIDSGMPEIEQMRKDIASQSTDAQRQNRLQTTLALKNEGVRGGQAATLLNRSSGDISQKLGMDVNKLAYEDAARRNNAKSAYYGNKAASGTSSYVR
jgi:hypothetical protein